MSRDEFLARWEQMPKLKRAELIDGVVYMPSPVSRPHERQGKLIQACPAGHGHPDADYAPTIFTALKEQPALRLRPARATGDEYMIEAAQRPEE